MPSLKEAGPQNNTEREEKVKKWYQNVLAFLQSDGYPIRPADAAFLRQTIRSILEEKPKADFIMSYPEIYERFLVQIYGVNVSGFFEKIKPEDSKKAKDDLDKYIQAKMRADRN